MTNFYLELAQRILEISPEPLTARQIINCALEHGLLPEPYRSARTPHRTVQARLSEEIRKLGPRSPFYRFAPGRFGLRANVTDRSNWRKYAKEYKAPIRKKQISDEFVLCISAQDFLPNEHEGFLPIDALTRFILHNSNLIYRPRRKVEHDSTYKQVVTYVAIIRDQHILCYERGAYAAVQNELLGCKSVGFGGHVNAHDRDLFSTDSWGIISNARRELFEELSITNGDTVKFLGLINDNSTDAGRRHVAVAMMLVCDENTDPTRGELEIRNLHWRTLKALPNDFNDFEVWSRIFLRYLLTKSCIANVGH